MKQEEDLRMESQLVWRDEYNIGVDILDKEHQRLFKIINKLFAFSDEEKKSRWACQEGIKYFKDHAMKHFAEEEKYMRSVHYEGLEMHRHLHQSFRKNTLPALEAELERSDYSADSVDHFLGVCAGWLIGHTLTEDRAIVGEGVSKWVDLLPEEEREALKKVIIQLVYDMFHLESHVVSETYSGEKFGKGVYYRLVYGAGQEERCEIFLVFEEKLLINTVGKALGIETGKLDTMLINTARYTAQQFVGRIMEHLPDMDGYELKEENLLTYEQFRNVFEKESLQVSLLIDTGEGYFSYCAIAPHLLEKGVAVPIGAENAVAEIEKYLTQKREEPVKRKILVVDDSLTIRQGMKLLLEEDYEVAMVDSGVAAIRCIILDRPDLVLLDYEMPVCNGKQVLEMLRSENVFEGLPVIFLTGRTDPETVRNLIAMRPDGYLAKYLKPEEVKKKIDIFFETRNA